MKQSVNLLSSDFIFKLPTINAYTVSAALVFSALTAGLYAWQQNSKAFTLQIAYLDIQTEYDDLNLAFEEQKDSYVPKAKDPNLNKRITQLRQEIAGKTKILSVLSTQNIATDQRPSKILKAIAKHQIDGLWLTDIQLQQHKKQMLLKGKTAKAEHLTVLLTALSKSAAFAGTNFSSLAIEKQKDTTKYLSFSLNTEPKEAIISATKPAVLPNQAVLQAVLNKQVNAQ